jgi:DNA invertase Pin-like site-specific DNA recombinase
MHREDSSGRSLRCAIYTRKSTDEGLDQDFNSLDAQREACRAFVMSQQHEGWRLDDTLYDDGGYSGGSMDRPALQQLLAEVKEGRIDVIIVYKVDRLTRSLTDFSKIVEIMDEAGASFVSVTQSFNTATSMGRLTLNVLLSFAQFEREIAGERIRDKIAASKKKGMWMGGVIPLGYRLGDRKLLVDKEEAEQVQTIFREYLSCGSLMALIERLDALGMKTKLRVTKSGRGIGGCSFGLGNLSWLLRNQLYRGMTVHKDQVWPGEHEAIVDEELWNAVQTRLNEKCNNKRAVRAKSPSLLAGLVRDEHGRKLVPSHSTKGSKRYRYYITATKADVAVDRPALRIPAHDLEKAVTERLLGLLRDPAQLAEHFPAQDLHDVMDGAEPMIEDLENGKPHVWRAALQGLVECVTVMTDSVRIGLKAETELGSGLID